jgi:hypothetical protein
MKLPNGDRALIPPAEVADYLSGLSDQAGGDTMIRELDLVVLTRDIIAHGLQQGEVSTVVHTYQDRQTFEVECVTAQRTTVAVLTLEPTDIRPVGDRATLHVRELVPASAA